MNTITGDLSSTLPMSFMPLNQTISQNRLNHTLGSNLPSKPFIFGSTISGNPVYLPEGERSITELSYLIKLLAMRKKEALKWRQTLDQLQKEYDDIFACENAQINFFQTKYGAEATRSLTQVEKNLKEKLKEITESKKQAQIDLENASNEFHRKRNKGQNDDLITNQEFENKLKIGLQNDLMALKNVRDAQYKEKFNDYNKLYDIVEKKKIENQRLASNLRDLIQENDKLSASESQKINADLERTKLREKQKAEVGFQSSIRNLEETEQMVQKDIEKCETRIKEKEIELKKELSEWKENVRDKLRKENQLSEAESMNLRARRIQDLEGEIAQLDKETCQLETNLEDRKKFYIEENQKQISRMRQEFSITGEELQQELARILAEIERLSHLIHEKNNILEELKSRYYSDRENNIREIIEKIGINNPEKLRYNILSKIQMLESQMIEKQRRKGREGVVTAVMLDEATLEKLQKEETLLLLKQCKEDLKAVNLISDKATLSSLRQKYSRSIEMNPSSGLFDQMNLDQKIERCAGMFDYLGGSAEPSVGIGAFPKLTLSLKGSEFSKMNPSQKIPAMPNESGSVFSELYVNDMSMSDSEMHESVTLKVNNKDLDDELEVLPSPNF